MGFIREFLTFEKKVLRSARKRKSPEFLAIMDGPAGRVDALFSEAGGVRFSSRDVGGETDRYVLLYAVLREDGVYDIAATWEEQFDLNSKREMKIGMLDHVPMDGEHVVGWIPENDQFCLEAEIAQERANRYMVANGFRSWWLVSFIFSKDNPRYEPIKPLRDSIPPIGTPVPFLAPKPGETLVICNVPPARVVERDGGLAARVPCDAGDDGTVYVSTEPAEVVDDPWHTGMKALFLRNTAARVWWRVGADGLPDGDAQREDTARIVAHVKLQEQLNRDIGLTAWGTPPATTDCISKAAKAMAKGDGRGK